MPWFEPALGALTDPDDRQAVYAAKRAAGDTHCIVEFFSPANPIVYDEPGQPYQIPSVIHEATPDAFRALVEEIIDARFTPVVAFDGDAGDRPLGYPNALRQLPILVALLDGLNDRILYARLWDSVFYGSSPEHIQAFGQAFRKLLPNGYLAIEHQPGRIPVGAGTADYLPGGMMTDYDTILGEFGSTTIHEPATWQVLGRMLPSGTYRRPADETGDPNPPCYVISGSPRGPYFYVAFETGGGGPAQPGAYDWVRGNCTVADLQRSGDYFRAMGVALVCLP